MFVQAAGAAKETATKPKTAAELENIAVKCGGIFC